MGSFLIWLSGADKELLAKCTNLQRSERIRFAGLGTLVLIPAILALFSMSYAVSTVAHSSRVFVPAGIVWSAIVLMIDRYLVSSIYKSTLRDRRSFGLPLLSRYLFALFVAIAVSHPFVLLWFNQSIDQRIAEDRRQAVAERLATAEAQKRKISVGKVSQQSSDLSKRLATATAHRDCLQELQTAEQSGRSVRLKCGFSSPLVGCEKRCIAIGNQIATIQQEISKISRQLDSAQQDERTHTTADRKDRREQTKRIDASASKDVKDIEARFSDDYLARVNALEEIARTHPQVTTVTVFMILFFVFVDILPVTMKVTTPMGEYEQIRDTLLLERQVRESVEREIISSGVPYRTVAEAKAGHAAKRDEIGALADVTLGLVRIYTEQMTDFENRMRAMSNGIGRSRKQRSFFVRQEALMRGTLNEAWTKAFAQFKAYLEKL